MSDHLTAKALLIKTDRKLTELELSGRAWISIEGAIFLSATILVVFVSWFWIWHFYQPV